MMRLKWLSGSLTKRSGRTLGAMLGIAFTIVIVSSIGSFISSSTASMTDRALQGLPVDWQIQLNQGTPLSSVTEALKSTTAVSKLEVVNYADVPGFRAATGGSVQETGTGKVLGVGKGYTGSFPSQIRSLLGTTDGVLLTQQTASNLNARPGDTVTILRQGLSPVDVKVDGIVDLPNADSIFQGIGLPSGAAPQAPPDNVILLPDAQWHTLFDGQAALRPDLVKTQLHVNIQHNFPADPASAYSYVQGLANKLEAKIAGSALIGNNLAARLSTLRSDALYATLLLLFLGIPGTVLAALLTILVTTSGERHRRNDQRLMRYQGASTSRILHVHMLEAIGVSLGGALLGIALSLLIDHSFVFSRTSASGTSVLWIGMATLLGVAFGILAVMIPALHSLKKEPGQHEENRRTFVRPLWQRAYLDIVFLLLSGIELWRTAASGYSIVIAPEGVASVAVNYEAFIGPFFLWIGGVLLALRIFDGLMAKERRQVRTAIGATAHSLAPIVAASLTRERNYLARGMLLVALALSFAVSTSIFNATYNAQARVDAELTNGADVTVTSLASFQNNDPRISKIASLPDVKAMQIMQHRFAYVGKDLQDLYGIDPVTIGTATNISNAFFANHNAQATFSALHAQKDGILVSEETIKDFQLNTGDLINLRLQFSSDKNYHIVPFHIVGVVREFPTAPKDSFLVANSSYISEMTGNPGSEVLLLHAAKSPEALAREVSSIVDIVGARVTDIGTTQRAINSGITSVDLRGLSSLELLFALVLLTASVALVLALGLAERRRNFAALVAIGAGKRQLDAFIHSEIFVILLSGLVAGALLGVGIAWMFVKVLSGVFDPPPEVLSIPWNYLFALFAGSMVATVIVSRIISTISRRSIIQELRGLA